MSERERLPSDRDSETVTLRLMHWISTEPCTICGHASAQRPETLHIYLTIGFYGDGRVAELFCRAGRQGGRSQGWLDLLCTIASMGLQVGLPLQDIATKMMGQRFRPDGYLVDVPKCLREPGKATVNVLSPADAIGRYLLAKYPNGRRQ